MLYSKPILGGPGYIYTIEHDINWMNVLEKLNCFYLIF